MELPIEMRFRVYDYIMTFDNLLSYGSLVKLALRSTSGLQLRGTCQDIYNETKTIFWRNKFCIADLGKSFKMGLSELLDNLREVTWDWHALKILDPQTLIALGLCKQLKVFHLRVTRSVVFGGDHLFDRRQYTYQDEPLAAKFSRSNGFDELLQLRGLETITVENHDHYKFWVKDKYLSNAELKAFETFLASKLTLPKKPPVCRYHILRFCALRC
ncbi:uncharacterized protein LY89DRAFT_312617 [Mollisia scopiformis]|uniref:Uncharacterized protein n=1 Tax=Mollisia scopiformis TaxID=149040 RepID=A0A194XRT4_MOLSC|nr:uncharacterized protein LY89DRAFT_312617 [Mollisia scopiformis]KUJ22861.1 hypothetical protein LY89DRAFT_312617 [Mollisia scopiformis]